MKYLQYIGVMAFILSCWEASAVNYASSVSPSGPWTGSIWTADGYPDDSSDKATLTMNDSIYLTSSTPLTITIDVLKFNQQSALFVGTNVTLIVSSIEVNKNAKLYVDGSLTSSGDMNMKKNSDLTIEADGDLQIDGNFNSGTDVILHVEGSMNVGGDFTLGTGGSITGTGGAITVSGSVTNNGTDVDDVIGGTLPVLLGYFRASVHQNEIVINWGTLAEINNDYFTIEKSLNGIDFKTLSAIPGAGNTDEEHHYQCIDQSPNFGHSYYRLRQTDFDGTTEVFKMIAVQFLGENSTKLKLYPNPVNDRPLNIIAQGLKSNSTVAIVVSDLSGRSVLHFEDVADEGGLLRTTIYQTTGLPPGIYMVSVYQDQIKMVQKLIKK